MKVGIFGGSFNPIHNGHLIIAEYIRDYAKLDKIFFVPVGKPSHREDNLAGASHRVEMIKRAIEDNPFFALSDIEIKEEKTSYTIDTLVKLKEMFPENEFFEIIGEDSVDYIEKWKDYEKLLEMAKFFVFKRKGFNFSKEMKNIEIVDTPIIEISSSEIRKRIREEKSIKYFLPKSVESYIQVNNIYKE